MDANETQQSSQLDNVFLKTLYLEQFVNKHKQDLAALKNYVETTRRQLQANPNAQIQFRDAEEFFKKEGMLTNVPKEADKLKSYKEFKEYKQKIWQVNHTEPFEDGVDNEDIFIASQTVNIICPLTKKPFENPVKSVTCGHTYSRDAMLSMLKRTKTVGCPVVGCNKSCNESQLERDVEMEETVKRELRKRSREVQKDPDDIMEL
ncbi:hypothetical protein SAMD00019534_093290 [Acytostelium subglobosum LB1]|uniref:hypothetical protein n=1 Tax=Acytostelium subglobosum LB1 TaxID=1410327 RepID=UPI0006448A72|nr:hypothetical protein SAMD00019534_093290 [Acytostelium subglobosum LB1]GAM26154.1 hypothetical protein SAMD00019534_093290 [Acytostelium subglobosum LB1]|eukprot:XP_012750708.1 hypothetical protein SAMD00019534_093290 [Acytostelium subglobosum LB1]